MAEKQGMATLNNVSYAYIFYMTFLESAFE